MSLSVDVFLRTDDGGMVLVDRPAGVSDAAGFESWRHDVWGSPRVRALGALHFPRLATEDLYVEPPEVSDFQQECALLRANLETVAAHVDPLNPNGMSLDFSTGRRIEATDPHADFVARVSLRLANIEDAARRAATIGGGIVIW